MRVALCYNAPDAMQMLFTFKAFAMAQLGIQLTQSRWRRFHGTTAFRWLAGAKWSASPLELAARADFPSRVVALLREGLWTRCCLLVNPTLIPPPPLLYCAEESARLTPAMLARLASLVGSWVQDRDRRSSNDAPPTAATTAQILAAAQTPWRPVTRHLYPPSFRRMTAAVLAVQRHLSCSPALPPLPLELWFHILSFVPRSAFAPSPAPSPFASSGG